MRETIVFLHAHHFGAARTIRKFKTYDTDAISITNGSPY